ncbi:CDP-alcohol phosphatidyltransferase family protein [Acidobacteria bacterium AH-259-D05]|nr:CDP-alcohol phosphatidyltransferase family protein [Acidobacteria bacterium AH-259-D05]
MANALTAFRLLLIFPFVSFMAREDAFSAAVAGIVLVLAILSDIVDGPIARRRGSVTAAGRAADHTADFLFITCGLIAGASRGVFPWILPLLIATAFVQYVIDSYWLHQQRALRMSRLGRYNGILYFVPLGGDILIRMGLSFLEPLLLPVCWALVVSTLLSIGDRLAALHHKRHRIYGARH